MKKVLFAVLAAISGMAAARRPIEGQMDRSLLACGGGRAFIVSSNGEVVWSKAGCGNIHRVWKHGDWVCYSNGTVRRVNVVSGKDELIHKPCEKEGVYGFEVLANGNIVVAENGTDYIAELEAETWKPVVRFKGNPANAEGKIPGGAHHHYRMVRKTEKGTYLVCCSSANIVREYDGNGGLVWEQKVPGLAFDCLRRANGNTLVSHLSAVSEFTPDHRVVWSFRCEDAPDLKLANLCGISERENGNLVIGTYANGVEDGSRATAFETTRDKRIVWSYAAAGKRFSMMTAFLIPDGAPYRPFKSAEGVWGEGRGKANAFLRFRAAFDARDGECPVLRITASTVYRAKLNGVFVGYGPARSAEGWFKVDEWPLGKARKGRNEIEIDVAGYDCKSYQYVIQPPFVQAEVVSGEGRVLAATSANGGGFAATEIPRDTGGAVYSRQRGFPGERYEVDPDAAQVAVPLVKAAPVKLLPRVVPYPEFKINDRFVDAAAGPGKVWAAPFNDTGFIGFKVKVAEPGTFAIRFDEALVDGRLDLFRNGNPSNSWHACLNHITWNVKKPGEYVFETFEPYTLKFVEGRMESGKGEISAPYLRQFRNPLPERARFVSSDPDLDRIFRAACDTLAENGVDIYTDCPGRERSAWLCDTWFSASAAAYLTGDFGVERAFLENFVLAPRYPKAIPEGAMPGGYPGSGLLSTYMMWYVLQCSEYVARAGEDGRAFAEFAKARVLRNIDFLVKYENADGLLEDLPGWVFIEWSHAGKLVKGINYPANMLWARTLDCAAALYGRKDLADKAVRLRDTIRRRSFDGTYFHDQELKGKDGRYTLNPDRTETCQYYAFFTGVATKERFPDLWRRMVDGFGPGRTSDGLYPSDMFFGRLLRLGLLAGDGHAAKTAAEIKKYLLGMVEESGTLWEFADGHDSRCHAFAAYVALLLVRDVVGLAVDHVRKTVCISSVDVPLSFCRISLPVKDGLVDFSMRRDASRTRRIVRLPSGWRLAEGSIGEVAASE